MDKAGAPRSPDPSVAHLGSSCDCSVGSQVQAPLAHPHHGLIALVSGLCDVFVDLLRGWQTGSGKAAGEMFLPVPRQCPPPLGARLCKVTAGSGHPQENGSASAQLGQAGGSGRRGVGANLFLVGQCRMHKLAVENAGALGVRGQQPYHESNLELEVEGEPVGRTEVCVQRQS